MTNVTICSVKPIVRRRLTSEAHANPTETFDAVAVSYADVAQRLDSDMERVEARLRRAAHVEFPSLGRMLDAIINNGGKRLRPALLLLASKPFAYDIQALIPAAAGIEMLHTASLVHDDTIDSSLLRRGQPTLNSLFDAGTVILIGDYLFAQSAILAAETMSPRVVAVFASSLADICDGQLREAFTAHLLNQTRDEYEKRIYGKTAALFAGAAEMGAILGQASDEDIQRVRAFGGDVGMAFQIVDDVLDVRETADTTGKPANLDLRQGTVTLPTMLFMAQQPAPADAALVQKVVDGNDVSDEEYAAVVEMIRASGAIEETVEAARRYVDRAIEHLAPLQNRQAVDDLAAFAHVALERVY